MEHQTVDLEKVIIKRRYQFEPKRPPMIETGVVFKQHNKDQECPACYSKALDKRKRNFHRVQVNPRQIIKLRGIQCLGCGYNISLQ